jgi:isoleucyl-tRNA synthetase
LRHPRAVTEAIEPLRRDKVVRSSLEAERHVPDAVLGFTDEGFSGRAVHHRPPVTRGELTVTRTTDHKCGRCWRHLPEVTEDGALCGRCEDVVARMDAETPCA